MKRYIVSFGVSTPFGNFLDEAVIVAACNKAMAVTLVQQEYCEPFQTVHDIKEVKDLSEAAAKLVKSKWRRYTDEEI